MKYFSMFSGIGTGEKGIEQAYRRKAEPQDCEGFRNVRSDVAGDGYGRELIEGNQYESAFAEPPNSIGGRERPTNIDRNGVLLADDAALRRSAAECVGFCEIDRHAEAIYRYHYPGHRNYGDATRIVPNELPDFDLLIGGFPCQAFSIAGKRLGFEDTRGTLFFEIARILREKRPSHFLLENVAGLLSHDDGNTFRTIVSTLIEIGYDLEWTVINSKDHGVPQNRERVFIIGHPRDGRCGEVFSLGDGDGGIVERSEQAAIANCFTAGGNSGGMHSSMTLLAEPVVGTLRRFKGEPGFREMKSNLSPTLKARARQDGDMQPVIAVASRGLPREGVNVQQLEPRSDGLTNTITSVEKDNLVAMRWVRSEKGKEARRQAQQEGRDYTPFGSEYREFAPTDDEYVGALTSAAANRDSFIGNESRIRRLTPIECERLQGLPDGFTALGRYGNEIREVADTNRYKGLGNAFTVNVIEAIIRAMRERGCLQ